MTEASVAELAELVAGRLVGDGVRRIVGLGDLRTAGPDRIGFVRDARYAAAAKATRAGALLTESELATTASQIVVDDVDVAVPVEEVDQGAGAVGARRGRIERRALGATGRAQVGADDHGDDEQGAEREAAAHVATGARLAPVRTAEAAATKRS